VLRIFKTSVEAKILLGYLIAIVLMVMVSVLGLLQLRQINNTVDILTNQLASNQKLADDVAHQIVLAQFHASRYVRTQNQADLDNFNQTFVELQALLALANEQIIAPERRVMLDKMGPDVKNYGDAFNQVARLIKKRQQLQQQVLGVQDFVIEQKLSALRIYVNSLNDPKLFLAFGNSQNAFQIMRLNVEKYLSTGDERYGILVNTAHQQVNNTLLVLTQAITNANQLQNVVEAQSAVAEYMKGFSEIQADFMVTKRLFQTKLDVLEPQITQRANDITASIKQSFELQNQFSQSLVIQTRDMLIFVTILAFFICLGLGIFISRRITTPLQAVMAVSQQIALVDLDALTMQMSTLIRGDVRLNFNITAKPLVVNLQDEVGQVAQSFNQIIFQLQKTEQAFGEMAIYLKRMAETAQAVGAGDLQVQVEAYSEDDILGHAFINMVAQLQQAEQLKHENLRLELELGVARRLQQMLLPTKMELQCIKTLDIAGFMEPADEIGGDYYDVLQHDGRVKIGIGDVTGHGLESGVLMLMTQMGVRTLLTSNEQDPIHFMDILNQTIYKNVQRMDNQKLLTLTLLDYLSQADVGGTLRLSGQHEEVIVVRQTGEIELIDTFAYGAPLGVDSNITEFIAEMTIHLEAGDGVVLFTDGITEARNQAGQLYGLERLCNTISCHWSQQSAEGVNELVITDVRQWIAPQKAVDDITLLVIKQK